MKKRLAPSFDNPWFVTLLYVTLTIAVTWPLATVMTTQIAGDLGDPVLNCWIMMWTGGQLLRFLKGDVSALADYWNGNIFYPERLTIAYSEHLAPQMLQILPVYAATGNMVLCYNLLFVSAIALSGLGMYLLVRELTRQPVAAVVAGVAFALSPYRVDQFPHLQVISSQWMPLALYGFHRYFAGGRPRALAGGMAALVVQVLSCGYFMFFFTPFAMAFYVYDAIVFGAWRRRAVWLQTAAASLIAALCVLPFVLPYIAVRQTTTMGVRPLDEIRAFSADTWAFFTTSENLWWLGSSLATRVKSEGSGFPGFTILALGLIGAATIAIGATRHARTSTPRKGFTWRTIVAILLGAAGVIMLAAWGWLLYSGGGTLRGTGWRFTVRDIGVLAGRSAIVLSAALLLLPGFRRFMLGVPRSVGGFIITAWVAAVTLTWGPLATANGRDIGFGPYAWLYSYVPGFNGMRVPSRFFMIASLFLAVLVGYGMARILERWRRSGLVVAGVAVCLMVAESLVMPFVTSKPLWVEHFEKQPKELRTGVAIGPVYQTVHDLPAGTLLLEFPFGAPPFDTQAAFYAGYHRKPMLNGFSGFFPRSYTERIPTLGWNPTEDRAAAWKTLKAAGVTHIVVHEGAYSDGKGADITAWLRSAGAREIAVNGTDRLFALK